MSLLTATEAVQATDGFMLTLYGSEIFKRWKELKDENHFLSERDFMSWLLDVAATKKRRRRKVKRGVSRGGGRQEEAVVRADSSATKTYTTGSCGFKIAKAPRVDSVIEDPDLSCSGENDVAVCWGGGTGLDDHDYSSRSTGDADDVRRVPVTSEVDREHHPPPATIIDNPASEKRFGCSLCPYVTQWRQNINRHRRLMHTHKRREKPRKQKLAYQCPACSYQARLKNIVGKHYNSVHLGITGNQCPYCSYSASKYNLLGHMQRYHAVRLAGQPTVTTQQTEADTTTTTTSGSRSRVEVIPANNLACFTSISK